MPLDCSQPFVFDVRNQRFTFCGIGLCDPQLVGTVNGVIPFVYQTVHMDWNIDDGEGGTGDISIPTGTSIEAFTTAQGDTSPGAWWTQTQADTSNPPKKGGAPVPRNYIEIVRGVIVDVPEAFTKFEDTSTSAKFSPPELNNADNGAFYVGMMQKATINNTYLQLKQSDTGCSYLLGTIKHAPGWVGASGPQTVRNGNVSVIGFVPLTVAICMGSEDDIRQISIPVVFGQSFRIGNNGSQPSPTTVDGTVYQPVTVTLVGNICYVPDVYSCQAPSAGSQGQLASNGLPAPGA
jgi:hypothetical protein